VSDLQGGPPVEGVAKEARRSLEVVVAVLLVIVARTEPSRFTYLKHVFGNATVDVILDRRLEERRRRQEQVPAERRREDRRQRDVTKDLQTLGWAVVRRLTMSALLDEGAP
jgi:hypothetical protein